MKLRTRGILYDPITRHTYRVKPGKPGDKLRRWANERKLGRKWK